MTAARVFLLALWLCALALMLWLADEPYEPIISRHGYWKDG